ncbi:hypothetical protein LBMAG56_17890 [Verrucomicrobiota bacterium]|nr:hypothetical protein LBMAG56_17890 [Verrucomicrobiota bacterium]
MKLFAGFLSKMKSTDEGGRSLLDLRMLRQMGLAAERFGSSTEMLTAVQADPRKKPAPASVSESGEEMNHEKYERHENKGPNRSWPTSNFLPRH